MHTVKRRTPLLLLAGVLAQAGTPFIGASTAQAAILPTTVTVSSTMIGGDKAGSPSVGPALDGDKVTSYSSRGTRDLIYNFPVRRAGLVPRANLRHQNQSTDCVTG